MKHRKKILIRARTEALLNMKYVYCFAFLLLCLTACDPMRRIHIKNETGNKAEVKWKLREADSLYKSPFFLSNDMSTRFELFPEKPYNEVNMSFGAGHWSNGYLKEVTNRLQSLEIKANGKTLAIDSAQLYTYLSQRRKGLGKRTIEITLKPAQR